MPPLTGAVAAWPPRGGGPFPPSRCRTAAPLLACGCAPSPRRFGGCCSGLPAARATSDRVPVWARRVVFFPGARSSADDRRAASTTGGGGCHDATVGPLPGPASACADPVGRPRTAVRTVPPSARRALHQRVTRPGGEPRRPPLWRTVARRTVLPCAPSLTAASAGFWTSPTSGRPTSPPPLPSDERVPHDPSPDIFFSSFFLFSFFPVFFFFWSSGRGGSGRGGAGRRQGVLLPSPLPVARRAWAVAPADLTAAAAAVAARGARSPGDQ